MSTCYLYYKICFFNKKGEPDVDTATRAYDWCLKNYEWFDGENGLPFIQDENWFIANEEDFEDGLTSYDAPEDLEWLEKVFKAVGAERLVAGLHWDYSDRSWDLNRYYECVWEKDKEPLCYKVNFDRRIEPAYDIIGEGFIDSFGSFRELYPAFKNKKTGETLFIGRVETDESEVEDFDYYVKAQMYIGGNEFSVLVGDEQIFLDDEGEASSFDNHQEQLINVFLETLRSIDEANKEDSLADGSVEDAKLIHDYSQSKVSDWEFAGFKSRLTYFDLYGQNPPKTNFKYITSDGRIDY